MREWQKILVSSMATIRETIEVIDQGAKKIALVVDDDRRLVGTVSDGDVRRGILQGISLEDAVTLVMNAAPTTALVQESREAVLALMKARHIQQIPILDRSGRVIDLEQLDDIVLTPRRENTIVLMAGGLGTRLRPLTDECPKPLLKVGGKPILENIIDHSMGFGFHRFVISVNYRAELIEAHFRDGSRWGAEIEYVRESKRMGTAGALSLLCKNYELPLIVMNGDVLSRVNLGHLLDFHEEHKAEATMCVRDYDFQIPYGVVRVDRHRLASIEEKPVHRFFVNAGIYVIGSFALSLIPPDSFFDMPSLFEALMAEGKETAVFPIREAWQDVGQLDDLERARGEYLEETDDQG